MSFKPASLAQLFDPPDDYRGTFGWLCGYSADAPFLEDAIERFSGLTHFQRAYQGHVMLAVMLDPGNPQITPAEVPGALHLPVKSAKLPFTLLHAKVAILGFQGPEGTVVRLIVSTGNWTRQTLEESLDLAWHIDLHNDTASGQDQTDLAAAWNFLLWVQTLFDLRLIGTEAVQNSVTRLAKQVADFGKPDADYSPRFFDNREKSFLSQLPDLVSKHGLGKRRNYIAFGSGFFEQVERADAIVPDTIFAALMAAGLVTKTCEKDLFVNPMSCQVVATAQTAIQNRGWKIRAARTPAYFGKAARALHAKFIFSANWREDSNQCGSPWVYLGSGNLSGQGFAHKASNRGNLEAGVVFSPEILCWSANSGKDDGADVISNLLPINWDDGIEEGQLGLCQGGEMPDRNAIFIAAPVAFFVWDEGQRLTPNGAGQADFKLLDCEGHCCEPLPDGSFDWFSDRPRQVTVTWSLNDVKMSASIPVIDEHGRYCAADLPELGLQDAWLHLASFPMPPDDEDFDDEDLNEPPTRGSGGKNRDARPHVAKGASYPVREMMIIIENIATRQANLSEADWPMWCNRLEQVLIQAKDCDVAKAFRQIKLNPFNPLSSKEFRPEFTGNYEEELGKLYEKALSAIVEAWGLDKAPKLGAGM